MRLCKTIMGALLGTFALTLSVISPVQAKDCGDVIITEMSWASGTVVTNIAKFIMENGYGCKVTVIPTTGEAALTSVAETGKPDIVTELWINSFPGYNKLEKAGKLSVAAEVLSDGGVEAYFVPKYLVDKHPELATIEGILKNPELVGNQFHDCPTSWACNPINTNNAKAYDFEGHGIKRFNHGSGETLDASIASAYESKKPWFGYYWSPTAILGKYPMALVKVAPYNKEIHTCNAKKDCATPGKSAYPSSRVVTVVSRSLKENNPDIYKLMQKLQFTNAQMEDVLAWKLAGNASLEEASVYFLSKYKKVWKNWLNASAKKKLEKVL